MGWSAICRVIRLVNGTRKLLHKTPLILVFLHRENGKLSLLTHNSKITKETLFPARKRARTFYNPFPSKSKMADRKELPSRVGESADHVSRQPLTRARSRNAKRAKLDLISSRVTHDIAQKQCQELLMMWSSTKNMSAQYNDPELSLINCVTYVTKSQNSTEQKEKAMRDSQVWTLRDMEFAL